MKAQIAAAAAALALFSAGSAFAQVGVSIGINQPGVYGRIDIGEPPPPVALIRPQPVYVVPVRQGYAPPPPIYLYVPVEQQRDWRRYCRRYDACARPVYFVRDEWVRQRYVQEHPDRDRGQHRGWERRDGHGGRDERRGGERDDRGPHGDRGERGERGDFRGGHGGDR